MNRESTVSRSRAKSFVDDLGLGRGVVLIRAATLLRSIETKPWTGRFVCYRQAYRLPVLTDVHARGVYDLRRHGYYRRRVVACLLSDHSGSCFGFAGPGVGQYFAT